MGSLSWDHKTRSISHHNRSLDSAGSFRTETPPTSSVLPWLLSPSPHPLCSVLSLRKPVTLLSASQNYILIVVAFSANLQLLWEQREASFPSNQVPNSTNIHTDTAKSQGTDKNEGKQPQFLQPLSRGTFSSPAPALAALFWTQSNSLFLF